MHKHSRTKDDSGRRVAWLRRVAPRTWVLVAVVAATALVSTGLVAFAPAPDRTPAAEHAVPVTGEWVSPGVHSPELNLFGRVETPRSATLTALVSAPVEGLDVREGERVAAGAVLVRLDDTDARLLLRRRQAQLAQAQADLQALKRTGAEEREVLAHQEQLQALAAAKVERYGQLREQGSIAQETLNAVLQENHAQAIALSRQRNLVDSFAHRLARATAQVETAAAAMDEAQVGRQRTSVRAPFAGRVTRIAVAPGELVSPGRAVAEIYDDGALEIRVQIPHAHLGVLEQALDAGEKPAALVDFGDYQTRGWLDRLVGAVAKGQSGVDGLVRLEADAPSPDLGRAVGLRMVLPPVAGTVAVPVPAVYGQRRLFVVEDGLLRGIDVRRVGETTTADGALKLLLRADALAEGATVLTSQLSNAVTGLRVRVAGDAAGHDEAADSPSKGTG